MKKGKAVLAQPAALAPRMRSSMSRAPPGPVRGDGDEAAYRASLRYRGLLQDYQELLKETEAKKRRLHMVRLVKKRHWAEVKFLRKRYKSMSENPSQTIAYRVKNRSVPPPTGRATWAADVEHQSVQLAPPRASPVIDLSEACEPSCEMEMGGRHGFREPIGINNTKSYSMEGDAGPSGMRMPMFLDAQDPAERAGKRKISPLVLGV